MPDEEGRAYLDSGGETDADARPARSVSSHAVPVVGVGASAGGIEAFTQLLGAMPPDSGAAFVLVLHLDPTRESQLSSILERHTRMPVAQVADGMQLRADHVYVIAPASDVTLQGDTLRLSKPAQPRGHGHPIDVLFRSLAEQRRERAVAIVLSGTGTNGTQGIKEIKAAGGLILVEDPSTARFDGMPRSAIGAGMADHVLSPGEMPATVLRYLRHDYMAAPDGLGALSGQQPGLDQLLGFLRARSGQDFRTYKPATVLRRVNRRMSLNNVTRLGDYIELLRVKPDEVQALLRDLLINVTSFFRDEEAWTTLGEVVIAQLVADRATDTSLRVWVPGCATGEEAYSIAMLLTERAEAAHKQFDVKVFASDILDDNLNVARAGVYPGASVEMLPPERIRRFFEKLDGSYRVRKNLRDLLVFARQDLLRDPPFSRVDLISCRNLLIYIEPEAQKRTLALFHFALREGGYLFLGSAETVGRVDDLFETISKKWRIYCRVGAARHNIVDFPLLGGHASGSPVSFPPESSQRVTEIARRVLLERFAPAAVLLDRRGRVLYFHGETADYLKQPSGEPTNDLLAMAREGLLVPLRGALRRVLDENQVASFRTRIRSGDTLRLISVTLSPLAESRLSSGLVLVTFEPQERAEVAQEVQAADHSDATAALENELRSTRADLQGTIERLEGVNEELKAANEEATSMNEELQSTNEELETSKEELQSFNEELHSVNSQLQHKISELDRTSNDLANLLSGTEIAWPG
jgi:two-component system, chemotaxis family, CheB/CheR fusion protein